MTHSRTPIRDITPHDPSRSSQHGPWSHRCGSPYHRVCRRRGGAVVDLRNIERQPNRDVEVAS